MAIHDCVNERTIATMETDIKHLKNNDVDIKKALEKLDTKVDKILWFILGQSVTLLVTVIGGLTLYAMVGK